MSTERPGPFLVLAGPTAVGKTEFSLQVAERLRAEIVSLDSRQVYRGLDVGTSKPSAPEQERITHHFVDELPLGVGWTAGRFAEAANTRIGDILERGSIPLVVGGSTLYLEALVHGLAEVPAGDPEVRSELLKQATATGGADALFDELCRIDPEGAATLDPSKTQRLVRALEVFRTTGRPWSTFFSEVTLPPYRYRVLVLNRSREEIYDRIETRVEVMLEAGLLEENRRLLDAGWRLNVNPLRTIGYQEPIAYLNGEITFDEMIGQLKRNTRRYAKRQLTWFRRHRDYQWIDLKDSERDLQELISTL